MLSRCHVDVLPGCFEISGGKAFREEDHIALNDTRSPAVLDTAYP
jgi:hypothetical protein